jgi:hypothetical protein
MQGAWEDLMKQLIRNRVSKVATYMEILLSLFIIAGILIVSVSVATDLVRDIPALWSGRQTFDFTAFLGLIMKLIIGAEFVKMISKHTAESTIEVLLFAVARKIVVADSGYFDVGIGILAIAILFLIKKYLTVTVNPNGYILEGDTSLKELNAMAGTSLSSEDGFTVREILNKELERLGNRPLVGLTIPVKDAQFKIFSMKEGIIDAVEVTGTHPKKSNRRWF